MKYFRVHLPKKFTADEECAHLFQTIDSMKAGEKIIWYMYSCELFMLFVGY